MNSWDKIKNVSVAEFYFFENGKKSTSIKEYSQAKINKNPSSI